MRFSSGKARAVAWGMAASGFGFGASPCSLAGRTKQARRCTKWGEVGLQGGRV